MADLADQPDVESRWRSLNVGQEATNCEAWLHSASAMLRLRVDGLDERVADDEDYEEAVRHVVASSVVRMFRGRDPRDPATWSSIFFTEAEVDLLTGGSSTGSSAYSIIPAGDTTTAGYWATPDEWVAL